MEFITPIIGIIILIIYSLVRRANEKYDPFRYIWSVEVLNEKYQEEKDKKANKIEQLKQLYNESFKRIRDGLLHANQYLPEIIEEAEHILGRRRSLEPLQKKAWEYIDRLAKLAGYSENETRNNEFYCLGWNEIWAIYNKNKKRILGKNDYSETPAPSKKTETSFNKTFLDQKKHFFREALYELQKASNHDELNQSYKRSVNFFLEYGAKFNWVFTDSIEDLALTALFDALWSTLSNNEDDQKTSYENCFESDNKGKKYHQDENYQHCRESIKEKNQKIFEGIWDIQELKRKYYRLAKINHPDKGGSHKAMQRLNELYTDALNRMQERETAYS